MGAATITSMALPNIGRPAGADETAGMARPMSFLWRFRLVELPSGFGNRVRYFFIPTGRI